MFPSLVDPKGPADFWKTYSLYLEQVSHNFRALFNTIDNFSNTIDRYWARFKTPLTAIDNNSKHYWQLCKTLLKTIDHYSKHYWPLLATIKNNIDNHYSKHYWPLLNIIELHWNNYWALLTQVLSMIEATTETTIEHYVTHYWALFYPKKRLPWSSL